MKKPLCALLLYLLLVVAPVVFPDPAGAQAMDTVRLSLNPGSYAYLPIFVAVDKGYFAKQHLNVEVTKYTGSALTQLPSLARGDLDIAPMVVGAGLFNQAAQGFDLKMIASIDQAHAGWHDTACVLVRQDLWASGTIRKVTDLRGKRVDAGPDGSPLNYLVKRILEKNRIATSDMTFTEKFAAVSDVFAAFRNKAIDVAINAEPACSEMEAQGIAHNWLSFKDALPNFQGAFITTSGAYLKAKRDVVRRFLVALLQAESEIKQSNGKWTPDLIATVAKWSEIPAATIAAIPGPPYSGQFGTIDTNAISDEETFWIASGSVKQKTPIGDIIDTSVLDEARRDTAKK